MANANILAAGTTAANSSTVVITTTPVTLSIFTAAGGAVPAGIVMDIEKLNSSATWTKTGLVLSSSANSVTGQPGVSLGISAPGSYRVARPVIPVAVGVDSDTTA